MSKRKPKMQMGGGDAGYDQEQISRDKQRNKVHFSTMLRPDIYEKAKAMAFWENTSIADVVGKALAEYIQEAEQRRNEAYEVLPPHRIEGD